MSAVASARPSSVSPAPGPRRVSTACSIRNPAPGGAVSCQTGEAAPITVTGAAVRTNGASRGPTCHSASSQLVAGRAIPPGGIMKQCADIRGTRAPSCLDCAGSSAWFGAEAVVIDLVVIGAGAALIALLAWYFFGPKRASQAQLVGQVQEVRVTVRGGYSPDLIRVRQSVPLRILFDRQESGECTSRVVFPDFALNRALP